MRIFCAMSRLFLLSDKLKDIVRASSIKKDNSSIKKALCHRILIFGRKVAIFDEFLAAKSWAVES